MVRFNSITIAWVVGWLLVTFTRLSFAVIHEGIDQLHPPLFDVFQGASLLGLPRISSYSHARTNRSRFAFIISNVPKSILTQDRLEITLWPYADDSSASKTVMDFMYLPAYTAHGTELISSNESEAVSVRNWIQLSNLTRVREYSLVMRFLPYPLSSGLNAPPEPNGAFDHFQCDVTVYPAASPEDPPIAHSEWAVSPEEVSRHGPEAVQLSTHLLTSFYRALQGESSGANQVVGVMGYSGVKFRHLMNNLGSLNEGRYLEVGVYRGSTFFSALASNRLYAVAVDLWQDSNLGSDEAAYDAFLTGLNRYRGENSVKVIVGDCWDVAFNRKDEVLEAMGGRTANIFFYDAGHTETEQFMALTNYLPLLDPLFIYVVDDWNQPMVRDGTHMAIQAMRLQVLLKIEVSTRGGLPSDHNDKDWWVGTGLFLLRKPDLSNQPQEQQVVQ